MHECFKIKIRSKIINLSRQNFTLASVTIPIKEGETEVELGRGVDDFITCHTTLLSLCKSVI